MVTKNYPDLANIDSLHTFGMTTSPSVKLRPLSANTSVGSYLETSSIFNVAIVFVSCLQEEQ